MGVWSEWVLGETESHPKENRLLHQFRLRTMLEPLSYHCCHATNSPLSWPIAGVAGDTVVGSKCFPVGQLAFVRAGLTQIPPAKSFCMFPSKKDGAWKSSYDITFSAASGQKRAYLKTDFNPFFWMPPRGESSSSSVQKWSVLVMHFHNSQNKYQKTILLICVSFVPKKVAFTKKIFRTLKPPFRHIFLINGLLAWSEQWLHPLAYCRGTHPRFSSQSRLNRTWSRLYTWRLKEAPLMIMIAEKKKDGKLCDNRWIGGLWTIPGHIYVFFSLERLS